MVPLEMKLTALAVAAAMVTGTPRDLEGGVDLPDPLLEGGALCVPAKPGQPALMRALLLAKTETTPFQPPAAKPVAPGDAPPLYRDLGPLSYKVTTKSAQAQRYFDQGLLFAFGFNHAEAQRAFQAAQKLDPSCAMCAWAEAWALGPNINVPMSPEANPPALAALARAQAAASGASAKERALIEALAARYSADPKADRAKLDAAFADAMKAVASRYPADDTIQVLYAEAVMDTQPWDYWEAAGAKPKGRNAEIVGTLERVLARNPSHMGAIHLYIHAMEASTQPEKALAHANRLAAMKPGAGHLMHMPAHIYYRLGMYRESLAINKRAMAIDERYFETSPSDPVYKNAYYPHNIHFVMVSAQMGGDAKTAIDAAGKLDRSISVEVAKQFAIMEPVKAAPYTTHAQFSDADTILALAAPAEELLLVKASYHYARAVAHAQKKDAVGAKREIAALEKLEKADFKAFEPYAIPAKEVVQTSRLVAQGRLADATGDLDAAAKAYEDAIFIEDSLAYMEPAYWYYPVRQSLGSVKLRQGKLDEARKAFRDSLARVRGNGWSMAGLVETEKRRGDAKAERAAREAFRKAWFGGAAPSLERL